MSTEPPGSGYIRIVVAEDHAMIRAGFAALIDAEPAMRVVGQAADGAQAVALTRQHHPDVVLMDVQMPGTNGLEATRQILQDASLASTRVLVVTTFDVDEYVYEALQAGASGFLLKGMQPVELIHAINVVVQGDALLAPSVTRRMIDEFARARAPRSSQLASSVTDREREVLRLLARGRSNQEIADALYVSPFTVKSHVSSLLMKHQLRDRVQLVVLAYESGVAG